MMETYRKIATVQAKLFEGGDEDGFVHPDGVLGAMEDARYGINSVVVPFIKTLENTHFTGEYGKNYLCVGVDGERWLVEKSIFERTYEKVKSGNESTSEQLPTKWFKTEEIETWIGESITTDKPIEEIQGGRGKLIILHQCGENKEELISQLETMIYGLKDGFESFAQ